MINNVLQSQLQGNCMKIQQRFEGYQTVQKLQNAPDLCSWTQGEVV